MHLLPTLTVLLQTRSVSRTACRLGLSQPTVSRALKRLREMLADPLLVRSGGRMILTQRGLELARPLEEWMAATLTVLQPPTFRPEALERRFVLAATDYGVLSVILSALPAIATAAPHCQIEVAAYSDDMFRKLASGEIDIVIYGREPDLAGTYARHLFRETLSLIVRDGHPLAAHGDAPVELDAYLAWPHVALSIGADGYDHVRRCLGDRDAERRVTVRLPYFLAAPEVIGTSDAILTMPTRAATRLASQGFVRLRPPEAIAGFDYWALLHERSARDPAAQWLIHMLSPARSITDRAAPRGLPDCLVASDAAGRAGP